VTWSRSRPPFRRKLFQLLAPTLERSIHCCYGCTSWMLVLTLLTLKFASFLRLSSLRFAIGLDAYSCRIMALPEALPQTEYGV
jgi:hypothetical protein